MRRKNKQQLARNVQLTLEKHRLAQSFKAMEEQVGIIVTSTEDSVKKSITRPHVPSKVGLFFLPFRITFQSYQKRNVVSTWSVRFSFGPSAGQRMMSTFCYIRAADKKKRADRSQKEEDEEEKSH